MSPKVFLILLPVFFSLYFDGSKNASSDSALGSGQFKFGSAALAKSPARIQHQIIVLHFFFFFSSVWVRIRSILSRIHNSSKNASSDPAPYFCIRILFLRFRIRSISTRIRSCSKNASSDPAPDYS